MSKDIKALLKEATKDLLTEDTLNSIQQAFDGAVTERTQIHVEKALNEQDNEYASKLEKLIVAIDKDHTNKLNRVVEAIDINHSDKLRRVVTGYEKALTTEATKFKAETVDTLSKYLDLYLEEKVPTASINEAVENKRAMLVLEEVKKILAVDHAMAQDSIREAVVDGKKTIDELTKALNEATSENKKLTESVNVTKSGLLVEKKISDLPDEKKAYMKRMLESKSPKYITENFDYILGLYDKNEQETLDVLKEQATNQSHSANAELPQVVTEQAEEEHANHPIFNTYMQELQKY